MGLLRALVAVVALVSLPSTLRASPIVLDFESFDDLASVGATIPGLTFTNATVLTAGISLNEFDFPPHSGDRVIFDDGGPIQIDFATPLASFGGYFNYTVPVFLEALDSSGASLGSTSSLFSSNIPFFGDPGSAPNEFLHLALPGIASVVITGDDFFGGSFTADDLTLDPVPEPSTLTLVVLGAGGVAALRRRRRTHRTAVDNDSGAIL